MRKLSWLVLVAAIAWPALGVSPKSSRRKPMPTPTPTAVPYFRAAGSCLRYEPGQYLVLAEVGQGGRVFRLDDESVIGAPVQTGARLRVLYVETADGPLAKRVLPGPVAASTRGAMREGAGEPGRGSPSSQAGTAEAK